jgi:hypothetical protein
MCEEACKTKVPLDWNGSKPYGMKFSVYELIRPKGNQTYTKLCEKCKLKLLVKILKGSDDGI